jgi:hypothetical protein
MVGLKKTISAEIVADSINSMGDRITSFLLTYPRIIHAELMTHRVFSRNSASSRAIPFEKMVESVRTDPFIPIAWQVAHKGMQGTKYLTKSAHVDFRRSQWLVARDSAIKHAEELNSTMGVRYSMDEDPHQLADTSVTKQLCNRLLEPFMWHTVLITATEFEGFFELRCPKYFGQYKSWKDAVSSGATLETPFEFRMNDSQAEIHIQALAEAMWDARNESIPIKLKDGDWHIPFGDRITLPPTIPIDAGYTLEQGVAIRKVKIATARCARLSYMTFDGEINYVKDIGLHDTLLASHHMSPFEHCARAMNSDEYIQFDRASPRIINGKMNKFFVDIEQAWCNNFRGFIPYRWFIENGTS